MSDRQRFSDKVVLVTGAAQGIGRGVALRGAEREAGEIVKNATTAAQRRGDEIVNDAKGAAEALRRRTDDELRREKRKAEAELKDEVSGIALDIAQRGVEKEIDPARHEAMIEEFLSGLGDAS